MNDTGNPVEQFPPVDTAGVSPGETSFIERHGIPPILFGFLSLGLIFFLYQAVGGVVTFLLFGVTPEAGHTAGFRIATALGQIILILGPTLLLARLATSRPAQYLRLRFPQPRVLLFPVIGIFSLQQMLQIYLVFQEKIPLPQRLVPIMKEFKELIEEAYRVLVSSNSIPELLVVIVVVALIPAIVEEIMFRGLVQRSFENGLTPMKSVVLSGIIFGAYHLNPFGFIPLAALGIYLGFLAMRANSIWVSAVAHFFNNASASLALYFHNDDDAIITGNPDTMSAGVLVLTFLVFSIIFLGSTYYFIRMTESRIK